MRAGAVLVRQAVIAGRVVDREGDSIPGVTEPSFLHHRLVRSGFGRAQRESAGTADSSQSGTSHGQSDGQLARLEADEAILAASRIQLNLRFR